MSDRLREINKKFRLLRPASEAEMRDEITTLRQQLEASEARCAELREANLDLIVRLQSLQDRQVADEAEKDG